MAKVKNKDRFGNTMDIDQMLKRFKREVDRDGIMEEVRKREFFLPKSIKRKVKSEAHQRLMRKLNKKLQKPKE